MGTTLVGGSTPLSNSTTNGNGVFGSAVDHFPVDQFIEPYDSVVLFGSWGFNQLLNPSPTSSPLSHFQFPFSASIG